MVVSTGTVGVDGSNLVVNGQSIAISASKTIEGLPWKDVDIVIESKGIYIEKTSACGNAANGAKVIIKCSANR